jgi:ribose-phosphate pyrophosphokinase
MKTDSIIFNLNDTDTLLNSIINKMNNKHHQIEIGKVNIQVFSDGETCVNFETSMRGKRVYILTSPNTALKIMQLNFAIDAAKRASAVEIIPIVPFFPYSRQDKRDQYRGPIGAKVMAEMIENRGATSIITFDLHAEQIEGFFNIPVIHLKGKHLFYETVLKHSNSNTVFCSPDAGGVKRVQRMRNLIIKHNESIDIPYVTIDKTREKPNEVGSMVIIGEVKGKDVLIIDDLCDTGGTLVKAADTLLANGALSVSVLITHAVMSGNAFQKISDSKIKKFIFSDTIDVDTKGYTMNGKLMMVSTADELSEAIISINNDISLYGAR